LWAAEALIDKAGLAVEELLHGDRESLTAERRGEVAVLIAAAKQRIVDTGLEVGTRVFEVTGARATSNSVGLDLFWRNLRTHSLHDPIAYKRVEVGRYALQGELPQPTWYT
jgi:alkylation response protein AidB-like acyl-CoA dehydrogenase